MESVRREHAAAQLVAHEREDIEVRRANALRLVACDFVEALDAARDLVRIAECHARRSRRPVRLRQGEATRSWRGARDALVNAPQLLAVALLGRSLDDVVRADEQGDHVGSERTEQRQLLPDEIVGGVAVYRGG